jgi:hypothetical protein
MKTGVFCCTVVGNSAVATISNLQKIVEGRVAVDEKWMGVLEYGCKE